MNELLDAGAHVNAVDDDGNSALHLSADGDCVDVMMPLLRRGAKLWLINGDGLTAGEILQESLNGQFIDMSECRWMSQVSEPV